MTEEPKDEGASEEELSPHEKVSQILQRARLSKHAISRTEVLRGLSECDPNVLVEIVREYISQRDPDSQELAIESLGFIPPEHPDAHSGVVCLVDTLKDGKEHLVLKALEVIKKLNVQGMDKHYINLTRHDSPRVRKAIGECLAELETVAATRALIALSREEQGDVRLWGLHHLRQLAFSHQPEVQALAAKRLAQQDPGTTTTAPIVLLARKQDPDVRNTLRDLLKKEVVYVRRGHFARVDRQTLHQQFQVLMCHVLGHRPH